MLAIIDYIVQGSDYSGNKIPGISHCMRQSELKLHHPKGIYFSFLMQNFGKMYVDDANSATANSHTVFDLGLGHEGWNFGKKQLKRIIISGGI